jgi:hypothetical protein
MALASQSVRRDLLTRTTLRLGSSPAPPAIDQVIRALQRVPGVLTVEADARGASALVLYTDGLIEYGHDAQDGEVRLLRAASDAVTTKA